jgi:hypothetical protein
MSAGDWVRLGLLIYGVCFFAVLQFLHRWGFRRRVQRLRTRRIIGTLALALAPLALVIGVILAIWRVLRFTGREIATYAGFDGEEGDVLH